jgi:NTP pyrophosphatase (non-canonical NTP hydrolase)
MNAITGLMGEAGETSDQIKKWYFHAPKYDYAEFRRRLVLEIGDVIFYTLKLMDLFGISLKEVLDGNREKLESRHPEMGKVTERFGPEAIR